METTAQIGFEQIWQAAAIEWFQPKRSWWEGLLPTFSPVSIGKALTPKITIELRADRQWGQSATSRAIGNSNVYLTTKQEAFARAYVKLANGADAYRAAYKVKPETKAETVWQEASRLLANPKVGARVDELREKAAQRAEWTAADRLRDLKTIFDASLGTDPRVAISAIAEANKMQGSYAPTKRELTGRDGGPIEYANLTEEEIDARIAALASGAGDDEPEAEA